MSIKLLTKQQMLNTCEHEAGGEDGDPNLQQNSQKGLILKNKQ